jgi:regulator of sigma E protease
MDLGLEQPGLLFTVATFAIVIGVLVFVHELGHYLAGRLFGVKAESFSIGFGREILGWTDRQGTRWKVSLLPLGGYVKFAGDANAASQPGTVDHLSDEERAHTLNGRPVWQRAIVVAAGPLTNFLFAIGIFAAFFSLYGRPYTPAVVAEVVPGTPAAAAGLQAGDRIVELGGQSIDRFEDLLRVVTLNPGHQLRAQVDRGGELVSLQVRPATIEEVDRFGNRYSRGQLGVKSAGQEVEQVDPFSAVAYAAQETVMLTRMMADSLVQIITGRRSVDELGGPLKIAQFSGQQASMGLASLIQFMALISINLGFINLLPVPMLDGGHLLLYAVEGLRRRPLDAKVQELAFACGFALLISLMLFLTWKDLASFGLWDHLAGLLG